MTEESIKILLIDDDEDEYVIIRELLSEISYMSFEISWAENYVRADEMIRNAQYNVFLIDYLLGEKDGIEIIKEFKKKGIHTPAILLTGKGDHALDMLAMQEGAVDYLEKYNINSSQLERSIRYAVQNEKIIKELRYSREKQQELAKKLLDSQEKERELVARDLHDSIGTSLSAVHFALEKEIHDIEKKGIQAMDLDGLNRVSSMVVDIIDETRRISGNLRPSILDNLGVLPAIKSFVRQYQKVYQNIFFEVQFGIEENAIPEKLKIILYRIIQESLTNAVKHSLATEVTLRITKNEKIILLDIKDNGQGFDLENVKKTSFENNNMGLDGMIERTKLSGGDIEIFSKIGEGSQIIARFPLMND